MYIAIEGIDTAGKSTQINLLQNQINALFIKEPGYTKVGQEIRELILSDIDKKTELFLFLADRSETISKIIKPNLNKTIISDRSLISGIAYAMDYFDVEFLININKFATDNILPNKIIILQLDKDTLTNRLSQKKQDKIEKRGIEYLLKIQKNLITISEKLNIPTLILDASLNQKDINQKIINFINSI